MSENKPKTVEKLLRGICPFCKSNETDMGYATENVHDLIIERGYCMNCAGVWTITYKLHKIEAKLDDKKLI